MKGSGSFSEARNVAQCQCGLPVRHGVVMKEGPDKGRYFSRCSKWPNGQCSFFQWDDNTPRAPNKTIDSLSSFQDADDSIIMITEGMGRPITIPQKFSVVENPSRPFSQGAKFGSKSFQSPFSSPQKFIQLFWFQNENVKFICYKAEDDEVYRIREMSGIEDLSECWTFRREKYMSRINYEKFLSSSGISVVNSDR
jgi:hypothetical protein